MNEDDRHLILDQFTRQAAHFAQSPMVNSERLLERMLQSAEAGPRDRVLDCGSGPGVVACAFAEKTRLAVGIDLTDAVLAQARDLQARRNLPNVAWVRGDCTRLPFAAGQFSIVLSRFTIHHLPDPRAAVREMQRVCRPGGRIVVVDSVPAAEKAEAFNAMERRRDPSHTQALPLPALLRLFEDPGFDAPHTEITRLEGDLDALLQRSFPEDGDKPRLRKMYEDSIEGDPLDRALHREGQSILFSWPLAILAVRKI